MKSFLEHLQEAASPDDFLRAAQELQYSDPERAARYQSMAASRAKRFQQLTQEFHRQSRISQYGEGLGGWLRSIFGGRSTSGTPGTALRTVEAGLKNKNIPGSSDDAAYTRAAALPQEERVVRHAALVHAARLRDIVQSNSANPADRALRQLDQQIQARAAQGLGGARITTVDGTETSREYLLPSSEGPKFVNLQRDERRADKAAEQAERQRAREDARAAREAAKAARGK